MASAPVLLFVVNVDWFFLSHRLPIAQEAAKQGYDVHIACGITDRLAELQAHGFTVHPLEIARGRTSVQKEIKAFFQIAALFWRVRPTLVHLVTIKPVLFGGILARVLRVPGVVAAISGLGFVYVARGWKASLNRLVTGSLYRVALGKKNLRVIFQNPEDRALLSRIAHLPPEKSIMINGSGIDLSTFIPQPLPSGTPRVAMACRLIANKGIWEFVEAARLLRQRGIAVQFCLAGAIDPDNPASLTEQDLASIKAEGVVELLGSRKDMERVFADAHIVALPSYYGEGLPKVLIEAAACGRAVVTTDMPGCRDAIEPGVSGLLIPPRDGAALAEAIAQLLADPERCAAYGQAGRALAERKFDIRQIVQTHFTIYQELMSHR